MSKYPHINQRMPPLYIALIAGLISSGSVGSDLAAEHVLPMWMQAGHPVIAVQADGRPEPLRFVVDSAAGATLVDSRIARLYDLTDKDAPPLLADGASANSVPLKPLRLTDWTIGSWHLRDSGLEADLSRFREDDSQAIDGIIGNSFTARWNARWDFFSGSLQLSSVPTPNSEASNCQANALKHRDDSLKNFAFINVKLGDGEVNAIAVVDTGAAQTVLNEQAAVALGLDTRGKDSRLRVRTKGTQGLGSRSHPTWLYTISKISSGGWAHAPMEVRISDLPIFKSLQLDMQPALILGADVMLLGAVEISKGADQICLDLPGV